MYRAPLFRTGRSDERRTAVLPHPRPEVPRRLSRLDRSTAAHRIL